LFDQEIERACLGFWTGEPEQDATDKTVVSRTTAAVGGIQTSWLQIGKR
jgi:hypothetical protein